VREGVGEEVGEGVGDKVGEAVGEEVGEELGEDVGEKLGVAFLAACPFDCCGAPQAVRKTLIRHKVRTGRTIPGAL